jgi:inner membrane protein
MTHKSHIAFSLVFTIPLSLTLLHCNLLHSRGEIVFFTIISILATLAPDIDHPKSFISQLIPQLSKIICKRTHHRGFTHNGKAIIFSSLIALIILIKFPIMALAWIVGYTLHIIADGMTVSGIRDFCNGKTFYSLPYRLRFKSGDIVDNSIFKINIIIIICYLYLMNNHILTFGNLV